MFALGKTGSPGGCSEERKPSANGGKGRTKGRDEEGRLPAIKRKRDKESAPVTRRGGGRNKLKNGFSLTAGPHYVQLHLFPF